MKLQLNKKKLKNLSKDNKVLPADMTPQIGGGGHRDTKHTVHCETKPSRCRHCFIDEG